MPTLDEEIAALENQLGLSETSNIDAEIAALENQLGFSRDYERIEKQRLQDKASKSGLSVPDVEQNEAIDEELSRFNAAQLKQGIKDAGAAITRPFQRMPEIYQQEVQAGLEGMKSDSLVQKGLGALQYYGAPYTAGGKALVGEPVSGALQTVGVPEQAAEFVGNIADVGMQVAVPGAVAGKIRSAMKAYSPVAARGGTVGVPKDFGLSNSPNAAAYAKYNAPAYLKEADALSASIVPSPDVVGVVERQLMKDISEAGGKAIQGSYDPKIRVSIQILQKLESDGIALSSIPQVLARNGMSLEEFGKMYRATVRSSAITLQQLSVVKKKLNALFGAYPETQAFIDKAAELEEINRNVGATFMRNWDKLDNAGRAIMVTQPVTAIRNAATQAGRTAVGIMEDAFKAMYSGNGIRASMHEAWTNVMDDFAAIFGRMSPTDRSKLAQLLDSPAGALHKAELLMPGGAHAVHEVATDSKTMKALMYFNRLQEGFFRQVAFESRMRQNLRKAGIDWNSVDPQKIPEAFWRDATQHAMDMTFSKAPEGAVARTFVAAFNNPVMRTIQPFPRFNYANALPFMRDFSPLGFTRALSDDTLKLLAEGKPEEFAKRASRAMVGTFMMDRAMQMRNEEYQENPDTKWYEYKGYDMRAFAPFSTYLGIAEMVQRPDRMKASDWAQFAIGLSRVAGTGLVLTDLLRGRTFDEAQRIAGEFAGQYAGRFTVPLRAGKDIMAEVDDREAIVRDVKQIPFFGPAMANVPYLSSEYMPPKYSPLKPGAMRNLNPGQRQLSGLIEVKKTDVQKEVDRLNIPFNITHSTTGIPEFDNMMHKYMYKYVDMGYKLVRETPDYKQAKPATQLVMLRDKVFKNAKKNALIELAHNDPDIAIVKRLKGRFDSQELESIKQETGIDLDILKRILGVPEVLQ